jgi:hypothetical protein
MIIYLEFIKDLLIKNRFQGNILYNDLNLIKGNSFY